MQSSQKPYGPAQTNNGDVWEALVNQAGEHFATAEKLRQREDQDPHPDYSASDRELAWGHAMSTHALNYKP